MSPQAQRAQGARQHESDSQWTIPAAPKVAECLDPSKPMPPTALPIAADSIAELTGQECGRRSREPRRPEYIELDDRSSADCNLGHYSLTRRLHRARHTECRNPSPGHSFAVHPAVAGRRICLQTYDEVSGIRSGIDMAPWVHRQWESPKRTSRLHPTFRNWPECRIGPSSGHSRATPSSPTTLEKSARNRPRASIPVEPAGAKPCDSEDQPGRHSG